MVTKRKEYKKALGIGLVEVTIALLIFLIGLLTLAQAFTTALAINRKNRENLIVTTLCKDKIEQLLSLDFDDSASNLSDPPDPPGPPPANCQASACAKTYKQDGKGLSDGGSVAPNPPDDNPPNNFYRDYIDLIGNRVDPSKAFFTRQWKIETNGDVKTIQVSVTGPPSLGLRSQTSMVAYKTKAQ